MSELWGSERLLLPVSLSIVVNSLFSLRTITCIAQFFTHETCLFHAMLK